MTKPPDEFDGDFNQPGRDPALDVPEVLEGDSQPALAATVKRANFKHFLQITTALHRRRFLELLERECGTRGPSIVDKIGDVINFYPHLPAPLLPRYDHDYFSFSLAMPYVEIADFLMKPDFRATLVRCIQAHFPPYVPTF